MKIERSLFLALTGVLSGSAACVIYTHDPANDPTSAAPTSTIPPGATAVPPTQPTAVAPSVPKHEVASGVRGHRGGVTPQTDGGAAPPTPPAGQCLDNSAATAGDCTKLTGPSAEGCVAAQGKCGAYNAYFRPKVAAQAYSCMQSAQNLCTSTAANDCGKSALQQACPDPNVATICQAYAGLCKTDANTCSSIVSGLNDQGRQKLAQCVTAGCSAGLYSCVEGLAAPTGAAGH